MASHHGGAGHLLNRGLDILTEDIEHTDINRTHSMDGTVALGDPDALGHSEDPTYQDRFTAFRRKIHDLHQRVAAGEGQPAEALDHIQKELQNLSITFHQPQPPAPAEPFGKVLCQYTHTPCVPHRNNPTWQTPQGRIYLFLMNMIPPSWRFGSLTLKQHQYYQQEQSKACQCKITRFDTHTSHAGNLFK